MLLKINAVYEVISAFRVTRHTWIFPVSLEIEFNAVRFINYTISKLCSTFAVRDWLNYNAMFYKTLIEKK